MRRALRGLLLAVALVGCAHAPPPLPAFVPDPIPRAFAVEGIPPEVAHNLTTSTPRALDLAHALAWARDILSQDSAPCRQSMALYNILLVTQWVRVEHTPNPVVSGGIDVPPLSPATAAWLDALDVAVQREGIRRLGPTRPLATSGASR